MTDGVASIEAIDVDGKVVVIHLAEGVDLTQPWLRQSLDEISDALRDAGAVFVLILDADSDVTAHTVEQIGDLISGTVTWTEGRDDG